MTEREKMIAGFNYNPNDEELKTLRIDAKLKTEKLNQTSITRKEERDFILKTLFGSIGKNIHVESTFNCNYGKNIHVGENFRANFNCVILDSAEVHIGKNCFIGPQVGIYTSSYPLDTVDRKYGYEFAESITIGDNCFIGGNSTINPGVKLGNNVTVASGSVVTKSFPDNVVIAGNPARVIKEVVKEEEYENFHKW